MRSKKLKNARKSRSRQRTKRTLRPEPLEARDLLAVTAGFSSGALTIVGDGANDTITISRHQQTGKVLVMGTGNQAVAIPGNPFPSQITSIDVDGGDGRDLIDLSGVHNQGSLAALAQFPADLNGEIKIKGGGKDDHIIGSAFDDDLEGGKGDDRIEGGDGDDTYQFDYETGDSKLKLDILVEAAGQGSDKLNFKDFNLGGVKREASAQSPTAYFDLGRVCALNNGGCFAQANNGDYLRDTTATGARGDQILYEPNNTPAIGDEVLVVRLVGEFEDVEGTSERDYIRGNELDNDLNGKNGHDLLFGMGGNDILEGGGGDDVLDGGQGDDTFDFDKGVVDMNDPSHLWQDRIIDQAGNDTLDFSDFDFPVVAKNASGVPAAFSLSTPADVGIPFYDLNGTPLKLVFGGTNQIENVIGSDFVDRIDGNASPNILDGGKGNDTLRGFGGADVLFGGDDDDDLRGGSGNDYLAGQAGSDKLRGEGDNDVLVDRIVDDIDGGTGSDDYRVNGFEFSQSLEVLANPDITEASGATFGGTDSNDPLLWVIQDGGGAKIHATNLNGDNLGEYSAVGANVSNEDWEDLAYYRSGNTDYLYVGDIGDNAASRNEIVIYRTVEPTLGGPTNVTVEKARLRYPGGVARDSEALMVDPANGDVYIVSKSEPQAGNARLYKIGAGNLDWSGAQAKFLSQVGTVDFPANTSKESPSAIDISRDGLEIVIKSDDVIKHYSRSSTNQSIANLLTGTNRDRQVVTTTDSGNREAVAWDPDGSKFYTLSEDTSSGKKKIQEYKRAVSLDGADIDFLAAAIRDGDQDEKLDVNRDGTVSSADHQHFVLYVVDTYFGDSNLDQEFNTTDYVSVFTAGKFGTGQAATWSEGDWNGDGFFDSSDFVLAFQFGSYEQGKYF